MPFVAHIVPDLGNPMNGIAVAAKLMAEEQGAQLIDARHVTPAFVREVDEVWVHSCWTPQVWCACLLASANDRRLVRMPHGNLDPVRLKYHGWKKRLVGLIERFCMRRARRIVATCEAEKRWIQAYLGRRCPPVEVTDLKRFFDFSHKEHKGHKDGETIHLMYLGRRHPLKGLEYLEEALKRISSVPSSLLPVTPQLKVVSNAFGAEKESVWDWCDVLVLPTLSENFGLVIAEALERGKRVITTDGAPAWGDGLELEFRVGERGLGFGGEIWAGYEGRLVYLRGYREGSDEMRVALLKAAIERELAKGGGER